LSDGHLICGDKDNKHPKIANYIIFATMANKLKNSARKKAKADPRKADPKAFKQEKEENIDWKKLARDERTWKITGTLFLLIAGFLLIARLRPSGIYRNDRGVPYEKAAIILFFYLERGL